MYSDQHILLPLLKADTEILQYHQKHHENNKWFSDIKKLNRHNCRIQILRFHLKQVADHVYETGNTHNKQKCLNSRLLLPQNKKYIKIIEKE